MSKEIEKYKEGLKKAISKINELDSKLKELSTKDEVAIIGYNCRFPGGANSSQEFWHLLTKGYNAVTKIKADRFKIEDYYDSEKGKPGKTYTQYASFLDVDIYKFDNLHFEISGKEAPCIDPQHRLLLEVSWEAMENAGLDIEKLRGSKTGVFIGLDSFDYSRAEIFSDTTENISPYSLMGISQHSAAGRLSYFFDFKGPAIVCNTACSSSLVALNTALDSLKNGQCDLAIVGGVNLLIGPEGFVGLAQFQGLSQDGKCKAFDESADGFGRGEGCGIIILKRLKDAKADGNVIEAIVKGAYIGQDGKSNGFYAPNGLSEQRVITQALKNAGLMPNDIDYIEAHGTGTSLGDFIECQALCEAFKSKKEPILIGSVKSNIGHLEAASGMAGLIKVLLAMKNQKIPPSVHVVEPNKNIDWNRIKVVTSLTNWEKTEGKRRAGISAFGVSGTLAHVIVEEADNEEQKPTTIMPHHLLTLSAKSEESLKNSLSNMMSYLKDTDKAIHHITYSSNVTRSSLAYRFAITGTSKESFIETIESALQNEEVYRYYSDKLQERNHKIAFLFTGQGSIYKGIGQQFYQYSMVYRETLDYCSKCFEEFLGISIIEAIFEGEEQLLTRPLYSQPIIFSIEYALTKLWNTLGIQPSIVIGHSIGEYVAACYAGLISLEDSIKMISWRGEMMESVNVRGKMVGVLTDVESIQEAICESGCKNVSIGAINASRNVTISGLEEEVDKVIRTLQYKKRVFINDLQIIRPYHSVVMKQYEKAYGEKLSGINFSKTNIKMISSVTGKLETEVLLTDRNYWTRHLSRTVNFEAAMQEAEKLGVDTFIEIGGNATLSGLAMQCIENEKAIFVNSLRHGETGYSEILNAVKTLYLKGIDIDWNRFNEGYEKEKCTLPNYPFQRRKIKVPQRAISSVLINQHDNNKNKSVNTPKEDIVFFQQLFENQLKLMKTQNELIRNSVEEFIDL